MINKISIIIDLSDRNTFEFNKNFFSLISQRLGKIDLVDVSKILKLDKTFKIKNEKLIVKQPNNYNELKEIFSDDKLILMYCINNQFKYFYINFLLARLKVKKFIVSDLGYNPEHFNYKDQSIIQKIIFFFRQRFGYYIIRFLSLINILPRIDYFFESSSFVLNSINKSISLRLKKKISFMDFSYYKNVIKINSRHYNLVDQPEINEDYIVFIDGMLFDHRDTIIRNGKSSIGTRKAYHDYIVDILSKLEATYKKKIIVCLHPSNNLALINNDYGKFKCVKYETDEFIKKAFIIVFHESSSITQGIMLKKRIICLGGKILGPFINNRCNLYAKPLKLKKFDLENFHIENDKKLIEDLDNSIKNYDNYINQNIITKKSILGVDQILQFFKKELPND